MIVTISNGKKEVSIFSLNFKEFYNLLISVINTIYELKDEGNPILSP
jgi:hypothetical protein